MDADLAVRAARAEIERDAALERARNAERALDAVMLKDTEALLDTLRVIGIPARDLRDIYSVVQEWRKNGGRPELLELYRDLSRCQES